MTTHRALVLGATGLIGRHLLRALLDSPHWQSVQVLTRRPLGFRHDKLHETVLPLEQMASRPDLFAVDDVFCCLGTTLRAAGSRSVFRQVDFDYCVQAAELARAQGADHFLVVSAVNASARSRVFYSRTKGQMEEAVEALDFRALTIMQPSLLLGDRSEFRTGERLAAAGMQLLRPVLGWTDADWLPVEAATVARAMLVAAREPVSGVRRLRYSDIQRLAGIN